MVRYSRRPALHSAADPRMRRAARAAERLTRQSSGNGNQSTESYAFDVVVRGPHGHDFPGSMSMSQLVGNSDTTTMPAIKATNTSVPVAGVEGSSVAVEGESAS